MANQPPPPLDDDWPTRGDTAAVTTQTDEYVETGPPAPPPEPDRRLGLGLLLGLLLVALAAAAIAAAWFLTRDDDNQGETTTVTTTRVAGAARRVDVPHLIGLRERDALVRLGEAGLRPKEVYRPTAKPTKVVVSQTPAEATVVKRGSQVTLVVDSGAPKVAVPDVAGKSKADAIAALQGAGLEANPATVPSDAPAGQVVAESPAAGTQAAKGTAVRINVSDGSGATTSTATPTTQTTQTTQTQSSSSTTAAPPPTTSVPDVLRAQVQAAATQLTQAGLLASLQYVPAQDPLGTVTAQSPKSGQTAKRRAHVTVSVSSGPGQKPQKTVPDTTGQTLDQAVSTVKSAGLRLIFAKVTITDRAQAGKVVEQTPAAGRTAPQNAQVLVYLGAFRE